MRIWLAGSLAVFSISLVGCISSGSAPGAAGAGGAAGEGGGGGEPDASCAPVRILITSPEASEEIEASVAIVEGKVESDAELTGLSYSIRGEQPIDLPPSTGDFSFEVKRRECTSRYRIVIEATNVEGCSDRIDRLITFDPPEPERTFACIEDLRANPPWVEAPGDEVEITWKVIHGPLIYALPTYLSETFSGRLVAPPGVEGAFFPERGTVTVENPDLEVWSLLFFEPIPSLAIGVGRSLRMDPDRVVVARGSTQWISIRNAVDADWTLEGGGTLLAEPPAGVERAAARFEGARPGTYTVRAVSASGAREGSMTVEVRELVRPDVTLGEIATLPYDFHASAIVALPDGSIVAGGGSGAPAKPAVLRLAPGAADWVACEVGLPDGRITRLVSDELGNAFAADDAGRVIAILPGQMDAIALPALPPETGGGPISGFRASGGAVYVQSGGPWEHRASLGADGWVQEGFPCAAVVLSEPGDGAWFGCTGGWQVWRWDPIAEIWVTTTGFPGRLISLDRDAEGGLVAATGFGMFHFPEGAERWMPFGGGGPYGESAVFLSAHDRILAGDRSGLWALDEAAGAWTQVQTPVAEGWEPFFLRMPDGRIVLGDKRPGGAIYEGFAGALR